MLNSSQSNGQAGQAHSQNTTQPTHEPAAMGTLKQKPEFVSNKLDIRSHKFAESSHLRVA